MKETLLITGASGLLGSHLAEMAMQESLRVVGVSNTEPIKGDSPEGIISIDGDVRDFDLLKQILTEYKPSLIVHLAAQTIVTEALHNPQQTFDTNVTGTWNVLQAAKECGGVRRIIVASSDKAYGASDSLPYLEQHTPKPIYPYDASKLMAELVAQSFCQTYNLPITITRCANIFGPRDMNFSRLIPGTIRSCLMNEPVIVRSDGTFKRSYVYVKDAADAYLRILLSNENLDGEVFNIGIEKPYSVLDIVNLVLEKLNYSRQNIVIQNTAAAEIKDQYISAQKIESRLGWKPTFEMNAALDETITWYRNYLAKTSK